MPLPEIPRIPIISDITDRAWRLADPIIGAGVGTAGRAIEAGRRGVEPIVDFGRRQTEPLVDAGGRVIDRGIEAGERVLDAGAGMVEPLIDAGGRIIGRAVETGEGVLRGIGSETVELAEQIIRRLMQVTNDSIDFMLRHVQDSTTRTLNFVEDIVRQSLSEADSEIEAAFNTVEEVALELARLPVEALALLGSGEEILHRAKERSASIRRYIERFRARRRSIPPTLIEHVEQILIEVEEELEASAVEAERLGERVFDDSRRLYELTVADAQRYGSAIIRQLEEAQHRASALREELRGGVAAVRDWARSRVDALMGYGEERIRSGLAIRTAGEAERWSSEVISAVYNLAGEIDNEASTRPEQIMEFGRQRVNDAVALALTVSTTANSAMDWLLTQRSTNAEWRRRMFETRDMAMHFLQDQFTRMERSVTSRGESVLDRTLHMGSDILHEGLDEGAGLYRDIRQTAVDFGRGVWAEATGFTNAIRFEPLRDDPPIPKNRTVPEIKIPTRSNLPAPAAGMSGGEDGEAAGANQAKASHRSNRATPRSSSKTRARSNTSQPSTPGATRKPRTNAASESPKQSHSNTETTTSTTTHLPTADAGGESAHANTAVTRAAPELTHRTKVPSDASSGAHSNSSSGPSNTESPKPAAEAPKPTTKPTAATAKPESHVPKGARINPVTKKEKPVRQESPSGQKPGQAVAQAGSNSATATTKPPPKASEKPEAAKPTHVPQAAKGVDTAAESAKAPPIASAQTPTVAKKQETIPPMKKAGMIGIQRKPSDREEPSDPAGFRNRLLQAGGEGMAPDSGTRAELMPHLGFDPYMMRFHTGPTAQAAAKSLSADAFTIGKDVFFAADKFDPRSPSGLGLIGHEATHVGQQLGLSGSKMRFHTKTGGDAMEQEAQEIGERIASNLSYGQGLRVQRYVRTYEPADDEPITGRVQIRLDRLSMQALTRAGQILSGRPRSQPIRLDEVNVDFEVDLEQYTGAEITEMWAEAIVAAVESARPASTTTIPAEEMLAPATHVLQKKLGDPTQEQAPEPPAKVDPEVMARILKITPSAQDKDMIRKLLVREHVDSLISESKRKQLQDEYENSGADIGSISGVRVASYSGNIHSDDRAAIEAKLKEYEINSYEDFVKLKTDFVAAFEKKGVDIVTYMLEENLNIVLQQKKRYLSRDKAQPDAPINSIRTSAQEVKKAMDVYIATIHATLNHYHWLAIGPKSNNPEYGNLDSVTEVIVSKVDEKAKEGIIEGYKRFSKVRQAHGDKHPILLGRNFNPNTILDEKNAGDLELKLFHHFEEVESDIRYAKGEMSPKKFWELPEMVSMTRKQLGVREGEGAAKTLDETQKAKAEDAKFWAILQAAAAIALAVTAMVATGGLAAVAMVGSAGLSVYSAAKAADEYMFKAAAVNSSLDQARLISKDEPSLFWLAVELVGAGLDVAGAVGAFGKLATIARRAMATTEAKALRELEEAARDAYKGTKGLAMSEDDFVARLLESAKKGVSGSEAMVKQAKLATELLEGTSARAVAIMKGDRAAIQSVVSEYGNWKGLMGSLTNGGEDAAKMSKNIGAWRQEIVDDLAKRGAKPLDNASTEVVSDFDLNVKSLDGKGAGERVLEFEKELASKYGANWSDALLMNFYTDKSQLMTVEAALKAVSPQKRAAILARVTEKSEKLNFAKMLEHAGHDPAAIRQVEEMMAAAGVKHSIEDLRAVGDAIKNKGRDALLRDIDGKIKELEALPQNSPQRVAKAEEITELQMEANFLTKEAYISPSAVKGGPLTTAEAYQSALSQLEMIRHVIHDCGGDILKACREYELFKYINRYAGAAGKAGVKSPGLTYFENLSTYIYKRARSAHMETGHLPGITPADEALESAVDGQWLLDQYNMFRKEVDDSLPKMREAAKKNPAEGWKPEGGPSNKPPAAGSPPSPSAGPSAPNAPSGPQNLHTPQPPDLKKGAGLPAAAVQTAKAVDKMMDKNGKKPTATVGPQNAVQSAGFSSSRAKEGIGMFIGTIPGLKNEVFITVMSSEDRSKFEQQLGAALASEKTGFGPKVHGKIDMGKDKLAFATDVVKGGYADSYKSSGNTPDDQVSSKYGNKGEMMKNAENIKPETFTDVESYSKSIFENGYYYVGPVDGFVTPEGRWKPVNFANATAMSADTVQDEAWKLHADQFNVLKDNLMKRHLEAKGVAGKKEK